MNAQSPLATVDDQTSPLSHANSTGIGLVLIHAETQNKVLTENSDSQSKPNQKFHYYYPVTFFGLHFWIRVIYQQQAPLILLHGQQPPSTATPKHKVTFT